MGDAVKPLWMVAGLISTAAGIAGIVLPLVPATPFLLLAAFAFARSSPALHDWLVTHPTLGPPISNWQNNGAISRPSKIAALAALAAALAMSVIASVPPTIIWLQILVILIVSAFILTRPDGPHNDV